ncbi:MAG: N-acetylmuramoyl-L-alanine amidase [Paracoccaceae bacterium]
MRALPPEAIRRPSPNHGERRGRGAEAGGIDMVVLHYTAMGDAEAACARLCDPETAVSAHYLVARDGAIVALVGEDRRAWHAGRSAWAGERDVNSRSIGIELDHPGRDGDGPWLPYAEAQFAALERLLAAVLARRPVPPERVLGHACVAPGRKSDPGPAFDWRRLARGGLAVWLDPEPAVFADDAEGDPAAFRDAAARLGAGLAPGAAWDAEAEAVWAALAARFLPALCGRRRASRRAVAHIERLARAFPARAC